MSGRDTGAIAVLEQALELIKSLDQYITCNRAVFDLPYDDDSEAEKITAYVQEREGILSQFMGMQEQADRLRQSGEIKNTHETDELQGWIKSYIQNIVKMDAEDEEKAKKKLEVYKQQAIEANKTQKSTMLYAESGGGYSFSGSEFDVKR